MSNEDEIWADESQPAAPNEPCDAMLVDVKDPSVSYDSNDIEASNDAEAIAKARERAHSHKIGKKVRLIFKQRGGGRLSRGYRSAIIIAKHPLQRGKR
jgi:hypothetical protein